MRPLLFDANDERKNSDSANALRPRRFKQCDEYYFYKVSFELPQNVTWTDE